MMAQPSDRPLRLRLADAAATERLGALIAGRLRIGDFIGLQGGLGAGKTTLMRGLVAALPPAGAANEVVSPTFTLAQTYETTGLMVTHMDLYRIESAEELIELGVDEALDLGAVVVEWSDRMPEPPEDRLVIDLTIADTDGRTAILSAFGTWCARMRGLGEAARGEGLVP